MTAIQYRRFSELVREGMYPPDALAKVWEEYYGPRPSKPVEARSADDDDRNIENDL